MASTPASSGYSTSIRKALNDRGVTNDRIGYSKAGGVTVDGRTFMNPDRVYSGAAYTTQNNFNNAWNAYNSANKAAASPATQQATSPYNPVPTRSTASQTYNPYSQTSRNPYTSQIDSTIQQLLNYGQNQANFDPYSTSAYKAAEAQANRAAQQNIRAAQEAYGGAGFGRSYALGERAQGIQNDATNYLMTQVLPQIEAQEQARRQQEYQNSLAALQQLIGQQGRADNLVQQDFNNNLAVADLTGNYMPQGAQQIINNLLGLKQQAETRGITAADRSNLSSQADALRAQLQSMGIDISNLGANTSAANARANVPAGTRTLAGQAQDLRNRQANLDAALAVSDLTGRVVSPANDWSQLYGRAQNAPFTQAGLTNAFNNAWATAQAVGFVTPELAQLTGLPEGMRTLEAEQIYSGIDQDIYDRLADQATVGQQQTEGMSVQDIARNINTALSFLGDNPNINNPEVRNRIESIIVSQTNDPVVAGQLFNMYGIPIPEDLQAEISGNSLINGGGGSLAQPLGGVLANYGGAIENAGRKYGVDPALLAAIIAHETGNGTSNAVRTKNNVGGIMGKNGLRSFNSIEDSIDYMASLLKRNYLDKGLNTIEAIQKKYAPVGAANDPTGLNKNWVNGVQRFYGMFSGR